MRDFGLSQVLTLSRQIAAELRAAAADPAMDLSRTDRMALLDLSLAIEAAVDRALGVAPLSAEAQIVVSRAVAAVVLSRSDFSSDTTAAVEHSFCDP